jgi:hypothetical protein
MAVTTTKGAEYKRRGCRIKCSAAQGFANTSTSVTVTFDTYDYDPDGMFVAVNNNIKILTSGRYSIVVEVCWNASGTSNRDIIIAVNGSTVAEKTDAGITGVELRSTFGLVLNLAKNDVISMRLWQTSGATLSITTATRLTVQELD